MSASSDLATRPEIPLQIITPADVRASIGRAKRSLEHAAGEIVWQIEREAWRTLGYPSWGAMREAEYGGAAFMVPSKSRPEIVARIEAAGLSKREVARTAGVDEGTVRNDLRRLSAEFSAPEPTPGDDDDVVDAARYRDPSVKRRGIRDVIGGPLRARIASGEAAPAITGLDGKTYAPKSEPVKPRRKPITDAHRGALYDLEKSVERLERLHADDRFAVNRGAIAELTGHRLDRLVASLTERSAELGRPQRGDDLPTSSLFTPSA